MNHRRLYPSIANQYLLLTLLIVLTLCSIGAALRVKVFNSDDVVYQVLSHTLNHRTGIVYIASDTFIFKTWVYILIPTQINSRLLLSIIGGTFAIIGFALYIFSYFLFSKSKRSPPDTHVSWWPLIWLAGLGYFFMAMLIAPNTRNVELGLDFITLFLCVHILKKSNNLLQLIGLYVWCGLLSFNDPYFLYFFLVPVMIWNTLLAIAQHSKAHLKILALSAALLAFSWATIRFMELVMRHFHVVVANNHPFVLISASELPAHLKLFFLSLTRIIGIDSPTHGPYVFISVILLISYAALLVCLLTQVRLNRWPTLKSGDHVLPLILIQLAIVACVFVFTSASSDLGTARYMVAVPFALALALGIALHDSLAKVTHIVVICLVVIVLANAAHSVLLLIAPGSSPALQQTAAHLPFNIPGGKDAVANLGNSQNEQIGQLIKASGYSKGYAEYWQAPINAYFSQGVTILNLYCVNDTFKPHLFLINTALGSIHAQRSFFIADRNSTDCDAALDRLKPVRQVETASFRVLFFDYDIGEHLLGS